MIINNNLGLPLSNCSCTIMESITIIYILCMPSCWNVAESINLISIVTYPGLGSLLTNPLSTHHPEEPVPDQLLQICTQDSLFKKLTFPRK